MFKLFRAKKVVKINTSKIDEYVYEIENKINSGSSSNIIVIYCNEDRDTAFQIVQKLNNDGHMAIMKKYYNDGYEIGIFL